jgi:hypothetical protein
VIPFFIGLALIINGLVVSRRQAEIQEREMKRVRGLDAGPSALNGAASPRTLRPADTNEFIPVPFSVTDQTTRHLGHAEPQTPPDTGKK